ncbi:MAG: TrbI/VirB10 family protein [Legionellales bacterium]|jgi:type IV secretory pathway VirB10-like protein
MGKKLQNLFGRLSDIKTRTLLIVVSLIVLVVVGLVVTTSREVQPPEVTAEVKAARIGEIQSLAGTGQYNEEYAKLQLAENERLAQEATKSGQAAIPRLINQQDANQANLSFGQEFCAECTYDTQGYDQNGYDAKGFDRNGYDAQGYDAEGFDKNGFNKEGYDKDGFDKDGFDKNGFDRNGCNREGLDVNGNPCYDAQGYNVDGYDHLGFDKDGYDKIGFDKDGYDKNGFDKNGCNRQGLDKDGKPCFAKDGFNALGYDKDGYDKNGFNKDGFDRNGFDKDGYDKDGFDKNGCNRQGLDRQGQPCNGISLPVNTPQNNQEAYRKILEDQQKARLAQLSADQAAAAKERNAAEQQAMQQAFEALLRSQSMSVVSNWKPGTQVYVRGMAPVETGLAGDGSGTGSETATGPVLYKAGSIVFAVLDTDINSDNPGPVLATIVQGPLQGSKVLGDIQIQQEAVMLRFSLLSSPDLPASLPFNAVAVDAETARTALATGVDNHYFLRYGSLFASAFLEGIGEAFLAGITQPVVEDTTNQLLIVQSADVTTKDAIAVGLGTVGQAWGENLADVFDMPPTVTVDSGTGIGLLFMQDFIAGQGVALLPETTTTPVSVTTNTATTTNTNSSAQ